MRLPETAGIIDSAPEIDDSDLSDFVAAGDDAEAVQMDSAVYVGATLGATAAQGIVETPQQLSARLAPIVPGRYFITLGYRMVFGADGTVTKVGHRVELPRNTSF